MTMTIDDIVDLIHADVHHQLDELLAILRPGRFPKAALRKTSSSLRKAIAIGGSKKPNGSSSYGPSSSRPKAGQSGPSWAT